jgi:hypothetical protein
MRKSLLFLGQLAALGLVGLALSTRVITEAPGHATALFLAGGVFTITLAVYIRD